MVFTYMLANPLITSAPAQAQTSKPNLNSELMIYNKSFCFHNVQLYFVIL